LPILELNNFSLDLLVAILNYLGVNGKGVSLFV
jgi:hypothetical protein